MVRRGTLPNYPIHLLLNYPGAFNKRLSLKLLVLTTQIPVACVGVLANSGPMPSSFPPVPSHGLVAGTRGSLGRNSPLPIPKQWHPRALHCLRAYQLPKHGECPLWRLPLNAHVAGWRPGPFPRVTRPTHCPRGLWRPGPRISGSPVPTTLSRPPMGPWPTAAN